MPAVAAATLISKGIWSGAGVFNVELIDPYPLLNEAARLGLPWLYGPTVEGAGLPGEFAKLYRLGGLTCLAGDVIGEYSFEKPLHVGDRLVFHDMAHYTMVKNTAFNGIRSPSIVLIQGGSRTVREFSYADYRDRLS